MRSKDALAAIAAALFLVLALGMQDEGRQQPKQQEEKKCALCGGTKVITCPHCHGDWRHFPQMVKCERKGITGCDGTGAIRCLKCRGKGYQKCKECGGKGWIETRKSTGGIFTKPGRRPCTACGGCIPTGRLGTGKVDCPQCQPMYYCEACNKYFKPGRWNHRPASHRSKGRYQPGNVPSCPDCAQARSDASGPLPPMKLCWVQSCPRCKGRGEYEKIGKCPHCHKGKIACPVCVPKGEP
jgi:hypothetical protein